MTTMMMMTMMTILCHNSTSRDLSKNDAYVYYNFSIDRIVEHI